MQQLARIKRIANDGMATVFVIRQSACSGDCHKCGGCGAAQETIEFEAVNPIGAGVGDFVHVEAASAPVLKAAVVMYMIPMVLFFLGYYLGDTLWGRGVLISCLAFVAGIGLAVVYDRLVVKKNQTVYTITGYAGQSLVKH